MSIDALMKGVEWKETGAVQTDETPVSTHEGVMNFLGIELRCYRLSSGQAVIHADDMNRLLEGMFRED